MPNGSWNSLVHDAEHDDDVPPFRLRDELRDDSNIVQRPLSVCHTHHTVKEIDLTLPPGVVEAYKKIVSEEIGCWK